jgi:hypothetical protein
VIPRLGRIVRAVSPFEIVTLVLLVVILALLLLGRR